MLTIDELSHYEREHLKAMENIPKGRAGRRTLMKRETELKELVRQLWNLQLTESGKSSW